MKIIGIDIGSIATKLVLLNDTGVVYRESLSISERSETVAAKIIEKALQANSLSRDSIDLIVGTSRSGGDAPFADMKKGLYMCLFKGALELFPDVKTIIDVGAENTTIVTLDKESQIKDFTVNDKCAAGGGVFLEAIAKAMGLSLDEMAAEAMKTEKTIDIASTCTIFAEQEILSYAFEDPPPPRSEILAGLHESLASRVVGLTGKVGVIPPVLLCGGVSLNPAFVRSFKKLINAEVYLTEAPQFVVALGAAVIGRNYILNSKESPHAGSGN
ncbi:MAG: hypothetical protein KJ826_02545 [Proteobacteria bacterium]|nr:hypothetical protein [Pseudomonadota bacterium]MBU4035392.1 hypothetical protein [Pseudomonadota bacterium]